LLQNKDNYQYMPMGLGICRLCLVHESIWILLYKLLSRKSRQK
jgi:hypothetical protein